MLSLSSIKNKCVGLNQSLKCLAEGRASKVYLAADADMKIKSQIQNLCAHMGVEIEPAPTMKDLGQAVGINVGSAVVTILKENAD